jgi:agmatine/peptidylarginine deiminase
LQIAKKIIEDELKHKLNKHSLCLVDWGGSGQQLFDDNEDEIVEMMAARNQMNGQGRADGFILNGSTLLEQGVAGRQADRGCVLCDLRGAVQSKW